MKTFYFIIFVLLVLGVGAGVYFLLNDRSEEMVSTIGTDPLNTTYTIGGEEFTLANGFAEKEITPGAAARVQTRYYGSDLRTDLDGDGVEDVVFLLTQDTGGTGVFYYVVAAVQREDGWEGSHALFLGDRIAPQNITKSQNPSHQNVFVVKYADRAQEEPMSTRPSIGKSLYLKLDPESMQFGEVVADFEGDANPDGMSLDMHPWKWVKTTYNNDTELVPNDTDAFTIIFHEDGTFSATTDCNVMSGTYDTSSTSTLFGENIAMTRKFCEGSQEQDFASMLGEVQSHFFTGKGELVFDLKFDSGSSIFVGM